MASNNAGANAKRAKEFESAKGPFMPRTPPVTLKQTYNAANKVVENYNSIMKKANEEVKKTLDALNKARLAAQVPLNNARQAAQVALNNASQAAQAAQRPANRQAELKQEDVEFNAQEKRERNLNTFGGRRNRKTKGRKTKGRKSRARKTRSRK